MGFLSKMLLKGDITSGGAIRRHPEEYALPVTLWECHSIVGINSRYRMVGGASSSLVRSDIDKQTAKSLASQQTGNEKPDML
jgi:hypothetical protein